MLWNHRIEFSDECVYVFKLCIYNYTVSSPYLFVNDDDHVIHYTRVSQPKVRRDGEPNIKICKNRVWSRHHSYYRKLWKTIKNEQGLRKTRFWVRDSVSHGEGISTPQRPS